MTYKLITGKLGGATDGGPEAATGTQEETSLRIARTGSGLELGAYQRSAPDTLRQVVPRTWPDFLAVQCPAHSARRREAAAHPGDCQPHRHGCAGHHRPDRSAGAGRLCQPAAL